MKPCPHGGTRHEVWHHPKGAPTLLEMAKLCPVCVQREQRAGVVLLRADGLTPFVLLDALKQKPAPVGEEGPVPRIRPVAIVCARCGKASKLKAKGMCTRCYEVDRREKAKAARAAADAADEARAIGEWTKAQKAPAQPKDIPGDSGGPMVDAPPASEDIETLRARLCAWDLWHQGQSNGGHPRVLDGLLSMARGAL